MMNIIITLLKDFSLTIENEDIIFIKNFDYEYIYWNKKYEEFLSKEFSISPSQIKNKTDFNLFPLSSAEECRKSDLEAKEKGYFIGYEEVSGIKYMIVKLKLLRGESLKNEILTLVKKCT